MNFKPGDLAVVVSRAEPQHTGKIVELIEGHGIRSWICEPELLGSDWMKTAWFECALRPIRDNPGEDETLTWAPRKETA